MVVRPKRLVLPDFAGIPISLNGSKEAWQLLGEGENVLLLGLGPKNAPFPVEFRNRRVFWLEEPLTLQKTGWESFPAQWKRVFAAQAKELFPTATSFLYLPGLRLAPDFWNGLLGALFASSWDRKSEPKSGLALLFGSANDLLHAELAYALCMQGKTLVTDIPAGERCLEKALEKATGGVIPELALSVNMRGFDSDGRLFGLLSALRVPTAIWFVDNPWHVLSRIRLPWWKKATLFVTDPSFIPLLLREGARHVSFLPLACAPHMWRKLPKDSQEAERQMHAQSPPLFVGRSAFPEKARFFAAVHCDNSILDTAFRLLYAGEEPDIHWWYRLFSPRLWPGTEARTPGFGAEECSREKRRLWVEHGLAAGLTLIGDEGWKTVLSQAPLAPPVDYYTNLPECYFRALCTLNVTSLQLPKSLSQRHFDVWAAGGFLLSDATEGLSIFPEELTRPICLASPDKMVQAVQRLRNDPEKGLSLRRAWRSHLAAHHTYMHRLASILSIV